MLILYKLSTTPRGIKEIKKGTYHSLTANIEFSACFEYHIRNFEMFLLFFFVCICTFAIGMRVEGGVKYFCGKMFYFP